MTIKRTAYNTTVGIGLVTKHIEAAIKEAFIRDVVFNRNLGLITSLEYKPVFITGTQTSESNIPFFAHPLAIENFKGHNFICMDIRPCIRQVSDVETAGADFAVRNQTDYNFAISRLVLNMAWLAGDISQLKLNLSFAGAVYAAWLSESISKRFALDPKDQMVLAIISHFYYQSLFFQGEHIEEEMLQRFAVHTIKATKAPSQLVFDIFDKIKDMDTIEDYCQNIKDILANIRLDGLNPGLLITMIGNTWFGNNSKENLAVALEHPPTWIAIVYMAIAERTFKNSMIAKIAERYGKGNLAKEFNDGMKILLDSYHEKETSGHERGLTFNEFN